MDEIDIWRSADILIKQYGDEARQIAAKRAHALATQRDGEGFAAWVQVVAAILELERKGPRAGEAVN
jgi:hypothetical protein